MMLFIRQWIQPIKTSSYETNYISVRILKVTSQSQWTVYPHEHFRRFPHKRFAQGLITTFRVFAASLQRDLALTLIANNRRALFKTPLTGVTQRPWRSWCRCTMSTRQLGIITLPETPLKPVLCLVQLKIVVLTWDYSSQDISVMVLCVRIFKTVYNSQNIERSSIFHC